MIDEPLAISGIECVDALCLEGFRVMRHVSGMTVLRRGSQTVLVPDRLLLPPHILDAILEEADLSHAKFVELLSDAPTQPELEVVPVR